MSYYYEDPGYAKYSNHSNDEYDEYESYSDYAEPNHTTPEPNYHHTEHSNDAVYEGDRTDIEWEVEGNRYELVELRHGGEEPEVGFKQQGLEYEVDTEERKGRELRHEEDKVQELRELKYRGAETDYGVHKPHKLRELDSTVDQWGYEQPCCRAP